MFLFVFLYLLENFLINFLDLTLIRNVFSEYYHDDLFLVSFSFKTYQFVLTLLVAFLVIQMQSPTVAAVKKNPQIIMFLFQSMLLMCCFMFGCFLYELTYEKAEVRSKIFKSEISKVLF